MAGHLLVVLAVLICLRLGWWQWERTHEADGTAQNFGYALLWPAFAIAFIYMWVRFLQLEKLRDADDAEAFDEGLAEILAEGGSAASPDADGKQRRSDDAGSSGADAAPTGGGSATKGETGAAAGDSGSLAESDGGPDGAKEVPRRRDPGPPSRGVIVSVANVGDDDSEDPELAAYNRALAELAERDRRRAT